MILRNGQVISSEPTHIGDVVDFLKDKNVKFPIDIVVSKTLVRKLTQQQYEEVLRYREYIESFKKKKVGRVAGKDYSKKI